MAQKKKSASRVVPGTLGSLAARADTGPADPRDVLGHDDIATRRKLLLTASRRAHLGRPDVRSEDFFGTGPQLQEDRDAGALMLAADDRPGRNVNPTDVNLPNEAQDVNLPYEGSVQDQQAQQAKQRRRKQHRIPQRLGDFGSTAARQSTSTILERQGDR